LALPLDLVLLFFNSCVSERVVGPVELYIIIVLLASVNSVFNTVSGVEFRFNPVVIIGLQIFNISTKLLEIKSSLHLGVA
jgi:hypothetical protein